MKKIVTTLALGLALVSSPAPAHHPAADTVDEEVYAMIDEMVADTPHASLVFDDTMGVDDTTTITVPSVSDAEDMIDDYLLSTLSLLEEEVTVTITFAEEVSVEAVSTGVQTNHWRERDDWGRQVIITVDTLLCNPDYDPDAYPPQVDCENIIPELE